TGWWRRSGARWTRRPLRPTSRRKPSDDLAVGRPRPEPESRPRARIDVRFRRPGVNGSEIRCLNPAVTRDEFVLVDGCLEINACPVVAFGSPAGSDDGPFSDAMRAVGLEPGEPHRHVEILQDV